MYEINSEHFTPPFLIIASKTEFLIDCLDGNPLPLVSTGKENRTQEDSNVILIKVKIACENITLFYIYILFYCTEKLKREKKQETKLKKLKKWVKQKKRFFFFILHRYILIYLILK